jgi:hypothetical protein
MTDVNRIETLLTQLSGIRLLSTIPDATNLEQYGLILPTYTVTITLKGGEQHTLEIGSKSPANSGYYVRQKGASAVQVVAQYNLDVLLNLLDSPPLSTPVPPTPTSMPTLTIPITATQTLSDTTVLTPTTP